MELGLWGPVDRLSLWSLLVSHRLRAGVAELTEDMSLSSTKACALGCQLLHV